MEKSANKAPAQKSMDLVEADDAAPPRLSGLPVWARAVGFDDRRRCLFPHLRSSSWTAKTAVLLDDVELRGEIVHPLRR